MSPSEISVSKLIFIIVLVIALPIYGSIKARQEAPYEAMIVGRTYYLKIGDEIVERKLVDKYQHTLLWYIGLPKGGEVIGIEHVIGPVRINND